MIWCLRLRDCKAISMAAILCFKQSSEFTSYLFSDFLAQFKGNINPVIDSMHKLARLYLDFDLMNWISLRFPFNQSKCISNWILDVGWNWILRQTKKSCRHLHAKKSTKTKILSINSIKVWDYEREKRNRASTVSLEEIKRAITTNFSIHHII